LSCDDAIYKKHMQYMDEIERHVPGFMKKFFVLLKSGTATVMLNDDMYLILNSLR